MQSFFLQHRFAVAMVILAGLFAGFLTYVWTAPELERSSAPSKIVFEDEVFVRRKPSDEARPWARTAKGTRLAIISEQEIWLEVELNSRTKGWVRRDQGTIALPPFKHPTPRQQAKQRLQQLLKYLNYALGLG